MCFFSTAKNAENTKLQNREPRNRGTGDVWVARPLQLLFVTVQVAASVSRRNFARGARSAPTDVGGYATGSIHAAA